MKSKYYGDTYKERSDCPQGLQIFAQVENTQYVLHADAEGYSPQKVSVSAIRSDGGYWTLTCDTLRIGYNDREYFADGRR